MDELIPDLAPNLYSQGKIGTGYAQVFDTGAPNPFDVYSDYIKKSVENEQKRQEKLDEFLASVDDIDQPWNVAKEELGKKINQYGDLIATKRAVGTPINSAELTKAQKELKDLAKVNESNYQKAMKIGTEMQDPLIYTKEESDAFQKEIKDATLDANGNPKEGGIYEVQKVLDKWQKGVETPNVIEDYKKIKPVAKDATGYKKETTEEDFDNTVKAQLTNYQKPQLKKLLKMYQDENRIGVKDFTPQDIDDNNQKVFDAIEVEMREDLKGQKELDVTPKTSSGSNYRSPGSNNKKKDFILSGSNKWDKNPKVKDKLLLNNQNSLTARFNLGDGNYVTLAPDSVLAVNTGTFQGLGISGTRAAEKGDKGYWTEDEAKKDLLPGERVVKENDGKYYKYVDAETVIIPFSSENISILEGLTGYKNIPDIYRDIYVNSGGNGDVFDENFNKTYGGVDMH